MTTISPKRRGRGLGAGAVFFIVVGVFCLLVLLLLRAPAASLLWKVLAPIVSFRNAISATEASVLRSELASTTAALADRTALYRENVQLKQLLGRSVVAHSVLAAVLERPPGVPYDTLIVDIGKDHALAAGSRVYAGGNAVIGTVSDVYDTTSRVALFSAPGESYEALLRGSIPLTVTGQGAGSMSGQVPAGTSVTVGDPVTLSGIGSAFTGTVSYVRQDSGASFITLYMQLPVNIFTLRYVQVQTAP